MPNFGMRFSVPAQGLLPTTSDVIRQGVDDGF
ncbi:MAG: hypothetical protein ACI9G1_003313 [Pirellulaceae bacterium]|jgi:hypothetical protein